jgi:hypothetical protein
VAAGFFNSQKKRNPHEMDTKNTLWQRDHRFSRKGCGKKGVGVLENYVTV